MFTSHLKTCIHKIIHTITLASGALPLEGGTGMFRGRDPLFSCQSTLPSLPIYHQYTAMIFNFQKKNAFSALFFLTSSSQGTKFPNFVPKTPHFQGKPALQTLLLETRAFKFSQGRNICNNIRLMLLISFCKNYVHINVKQNKYSGKLLDLTHE